MATITMPRKVYTCALEASDWMRDNGAHVERFMRRGYGTTVEMYVPDENVGRLLWHVGTLADSLDGDYDTADDVRAMRKWLRRHEAKSTEV